MKSLQDLERRVIRIEKRNERVELDKAWETSAVRKIVLILYTYVLIGLFLWYAGNPQPWLNAIVPSVGFFLSTLTLPFFKNWWISRKSR